jgi:hypothetical protein
MLVTDNDSVHLAARLVVGGFISIVGFFFRRAFRDSSTGVELNSITNAPATKEAAQERSAENFYTNSRLPENSPFHEQDRKPDGLYWQKTSFAWRCLSFSNSYRGSLRGIETWIFDVTYRSDAGQRLTQTLAAFRREGELASIPAPSAAPDGQVFEIAGYWLICFNEGKTVLPGKFETWCNAALDTAMKPCAVAC